MKIRRATRLVYLGLGGVCLLFFQNCSPISVQEQAEQASVDQANACMASSADACLFNKSPAGQMGRGVSIDTIGGFQFTAVTIDDLKTGSEFLENTDISVTTKDETKRLKRSEKYKFFYDPSVSKLEQVSAYYWMNKGRQRMTTVGYNPLDGKALTIIADSSFSGWVASKNEVHLQRDDRHFSAALDASVSLGLLIHASASIASTGGSDGATKASSCTDPHGYANPKGCCNDANGCTPAIVAGAGDYFAATFFPDFPAIGDGWQNDPAGVQVCGLARNPSTNSTLTAASAYAKCASRSAAGNVYAMGIVYASVWWEVRKKVSDKNDFDKFFLRHLRAISGDDDFLTIQTKLTNLDVNEFNGKYSALFTAEFDKRGL